VQNPVLRDPALLRRYVVGWLPLLALLLVTLDVGAGTHGGTSTAPTLVSRYAYPIGNTHVAWRHGKYLFVGDEINGARRWLRVGVTVQPFSWASSTSSSSM